MSFVAELRRRNVIRVAGFYLVAAWLVVQVAETLLPAFDVPGWVLRAIIILLALGFLPTLVFAWVFELTPQGLKRERDIDRTQSVVDHTARKLDIAVLSMLVLVAGFTLWLGQRGPAADVQQADAPAAPATATPEVSAAAADKSIAVLPFADFSPGGDQAWFADGLAEEILNALARTPDLQVAARTSSFRYKGSTLAVPEIGRELGVAHVLEGSVRSTPARVRVTAQLIRASDGFHLWSQNYDRDPADMIEIQEDLARQIATAMQTSMDPAALADMASVGTQSVEAYQAYIRGVARTLDLEGEDFKAAYDYFEQARALDPGFAAAHGRAANFWLQQLDPTSTLADLTDDSAEQMARNFSERIDAAIRSAATDIDRLGYRALKAERELRLREAIELYRALLAARPGDVHASAQLMSLAGQASDQALLVELLDATWPQALQRTDVASSHINWAHRAADKAKAADQALALAQRWADQRAILYQAHRALLWDRRVDEARDVLQRLRAMTTPGDVWSALPPARQACAEGRRDEVERALAAIPESDMSQRWLLLMMLGRRAEADALLMPLEQAGNTFALAGFLAYPQFDPSPFPSLVAVLAREQVQRPAPLPQPFACPSERSPG